VPSGLTSDYTGLDIIPFWGVIQRLLAADESFELIKAIFAPGGLSVKTDRGWDGPMAFEGPRAALLKVVNKFLQEKWKEAWRNGFSWAGW
jgi:hypothetical protein